MDGPYGWKEHDEVLYASYFNMKGTDVPPVSAYCASYSYSMDISTEYAKHLSILI